MTGRPNRRTVLRALGGAAGTALVAGRGTAQEAAGSGGAVSPEWTRSFEGTVYTRQRREALYAAQSRPDGTGRLLAFDLRDGTERWRREVSVGRHPHLRVFEDHVLVVRDSTGAIEAFAAETGDRRWEATYESLGERSRLSTTPVGETILVADGQEEVARNRLVGLDAATGEVAWDHEVSLPGTHLEVTLPWSFEPSTDEYVLFASTGGHHLLRLNPTTGTVRAEHTIPLADAAEENELTMTSLGQEQQKDLLVVTSSVRPTGAGGDFQRVKRAYRDPGADPVLTASGREILRNYAADEIRWFVRTGAGTVRALSVPAGEVLWEAPIPESRSFRYSSWDDRFYGLSFTETDGDGFDGHLEARDAATGQVAWTRTVIEDGFGDTEYDGPPFVGFRPRDRNVYVEVEPGEYVALDPASGEPRDWRVTLPDDADDYSLFPNRRPHLLIGTASPFDRSEGETQVSVYPPPTGTGPVPTTGGSGTESTDLDVDVTNNFVTAQPDGFLDALFGSVEGAIMPPGTGSGPDRDQAYVDVDLSVTLPSTPDRTVETVTATFETEGTEFGTTTLTRRSTTEYGVEGLSISAPMQAGEGINVVHVQQILSLLSLPSGAPQGAPFGEAIQAKTSAYPDVSLTRVTVTYADGSEETFDADRTLPRYADTCPDNPLLSANPLNYPRPTCERNAFPRGGLERAEGTVVLSPASVVLEDADGNRTGRARTGDGWEVVDEIEGAIYSGPLDHEFVLAPGNGEYTTRVVGTDDGSATVVNTRAGVEDGEPRLSRTVFEDVSMSSETVLSAGVTDASLDVTAGPDAGETISADVTETVGFEAALEDVDVRIDAAESSGLAHFPTAAALAGVGGGLYAALRGRLAGED